MDESTTFGRQLRQFALSIDLIDRSHFAEIQQMLQASTAMRPGTVGNWIPIRERDSDDAFFNVAGLRMLRVPRSDDGALDAQGFKKELRESLGAMFKTEPGQ